VHAWIYCPVEVFTEGANAIELALGDLVSKRAQIAMVGRRECIRRTGLSDNLMR